MTSPRADMAKTIAQDFFWRAADSNDFAKIDLCLQKGADIEARKSDGHTALSQAIWSGNIDLAKGLIARGADLFIDVSGNKIFTGIENFKSHNRSTAQNLEALVLSSMPDATAPLDKTDYCYDFVNRRLHAEIDAKSSSGIDRCLAKGADIDGALHGKTPLIKALGLNNGALIDHVLDKNPDVNRPDDETTPLIHACYKKESPVLVKRLVDMGADIFGRDTHGETVFDKLKSNGNWNDATAKRECETYLLSQLPDIKTAPIDPRVKEDTTSAPMPELKKKPFTPGGPGKGQT